MLMIVFVVSIVAFLAGIAWQVWGGHFKDKPWSGKATTVAKKAVTIGIFVLILTFLLWYFSSAIARVPVIIIAAIAAIAYWWKLLKATTSKAGLFGLKTLATAAVLTFMVWGGHHAFVWYRNWFFGSTSAAQQPTAKNQADVQLPNHQPEQQPDKKVQEPNQPKPEIKGGDKTVPDNPAPKKRRPPRKASGSGTLRVQPPERPALSSSQPAAGGFTSAEDRAEAEANYKDCLYTLANTPPGIDPASYRARKKCEYLRPR